MTDHTLASQPAIDIAQLRLKDALDFAPLLAAYAQALKRGAPRFNAWA